MPVQGRIALARVREGRQRLRSMNLLDELAAVLDANGIPHALISAAALAAAGVARGAMSVRWRWSSDDRSGRRGRSGDAATSAFDAGTLGVHSIIGRRGPRGDAPAQRVTWHSNDAASSGSPLPL